MKRKKKLTKKERRGLRAGDQESLGKQLTHSPELRQTFKDQLRAFREKFGRDPGPTDPVFFDPDADEPRPIDEVKAKTDFLEAARMAGLRPKSLAFVEENYDKDAAFECPACSHRMKAWALSFPVCPECGDKMERKMVITK